MSGEPSAAHTPLPWGISYGFNLGLARAPATYIAGPKPEQIGIKLATPWIEGAWDNDPEADANVAFIVRACNSHYELLDALEQITLAYHALHIARDVDPSESAALTKARAALAKAYAASGIETEGHDRAAGRGAKHESATAESGDAQNIAQDIGGPSQ